MSFSIRNKLLSAFALLLVLMTGGSINHWWQLNSMTLIQQRIMELSIFNEQVLIAGTELHSTAQQLNKPTSITTQSMFNQQQETEQAMAAISQISDTLHEVAYNTVKASESAQQTSTVSLQGSESVEETVTSIKPLAGTLDIVKTTLRKSHETSLAVTRSNDLTLKMGLITSPFQVL